MNKTNFNTTCYILFAVLFFKTPSLWAQIPNDFKMVNAVIANGELVIMASKTSSSNDFDFLAGKWTMDNKRLKTRLNNCTEWVEYKSSDENFGSLLNGLGN